MKILFIIPYIPFPLNSGGNQAFFNMVDYLRHKMDVSILLQVQYASEAYDISKLKEIWDNVTFLYLQKKMISNLKYTIHSTTNGSSRQNNL